MTKSGFFYHYMSNLLNNKNNSHIVVNDSHSPITQVEENKNLYTAHDIKRTGCARCFQHITGQPMQQILHAVDYNIRQNFPILQEDLEMAEDIYGPSVPHLQVKKVHHKVHRVEPIVVPKFPKGIIDK